MNEFNYRMAVTIEDFYAPHEFKINEEYVKWVFRLRGKKDGESFEKMVPFHICEESDYAEFYPIKRDQVKKLANI